MTFISNYMQTSVILWAIFIANVFLWFYVFYSQLENILIHKNNGKLTSVIPATAENNSNAAPVDILENQSALTGLQFNEITAGPDHTFYSSRLPQIERPDFFEGKKYTEIEFKLTALSEKGKLEIIVPPESFGNNPMTYLDGVIAKLKSDKATVILTNLDHDNFGFYKPNIETFYDGVDVMTNFSRPTFIMKEDVYDFVETLKLKYDNIILLAGPNEVWTFKVLQANLVKPPQVSISI